MTDQTPDHEMRPAVTRMDKDLRKAAETLSPKEARYLVDAYYIAQDARKRTANQARGMSDEPTILIEWLADQNLVLEVQVKAALQRYSENHPRGEWPLSVFGIGPVITAGLLAHIDMDRCPTVGHLWSFAGLDPERKWEKGKKRPYNAALKTLCWHIGQCFMRFSKNEKDYYGHLYQERKVQEIRRNEAGEFANQAAKILKEKRFDKKTDAYKAYIIGKLPPAHVDARARRWVVKIFLSHVHAVWFQIEFGRPAPEPYALAITGHAHLITPPDFSQKS